MKMGFEGWKGLERIRRTGRGWRTVGNWKGIGWGLDEVRRGWGSSDGFPKNELRWADLNLSWDEPDWAERSMPELFGLGAAHAGLWIRPLPPRAGGRGRARAMPGPR